jgi:radical SAM superfamily enzyme YgiQ (UPF0313 family)
MAQVILFSDSNGPYGWARTLGPNSIAGTLRLHGYSVQNIDFFAWLTLEDLTKIVEKYVSQETLLVGFSTTHISKFCNNIPDDKEKFILYWKACKYFPQNNNTIQTFFKLIKDKNPNVKICMGGSKILDTPMDYPGIDHWFIGDSNKSILEVLNGNHSDSIVHSRSYPYRNFNISQTRWTEEDIILNNEHLPIEFSRSCSFKCNFCYFSKKIKTFGNQQRTIKNIKEELLYNYEMFGTTGYLINDLTFNAPHNRFKDICEMIISLPFKIEYSAWIRLDQIKNYNEQRELLIESGAKSLQCGIETMDPGALKRINKGLTKDEIIETLLFLKEKFENKINIGSGFIVGLENESEESIYNTFDWLMKDKLLDSFSFTPLYIAKSEELTKEQLDAWDWPLLTEKGWKNTHFNFNRAIEIAKELNNKAVIKPYGSYYNRLRNIGYTEEECLNFNMDYKESHLKTLDETRNLKDKYLRTLLCD